MGFTDPLNVPPVGNISPDPQTVHTTNGTASIIFYAIDVEESVSVEGIEKIQASANLTEVGEVTDTVNIRVSTGAVGIILEPVEGDEILPTDETATINVTIVKADYITPIAYDGDITLSTTGPGTLSNNTINGVPSGQTTVTLTSTGTPGVVEIAASAPDLDMGYTEVTFTGEADSILVSSEKNSIYPGEETTITVTIVDINNTPVGFDEVVTLNVPSDYGIFDDNSNSVDLSFTGESSLTSIFKASLTSPLGNVTISASGGGLTGSTNIEILNPLVPHHIELFAFPSSVDVFGVETSTTITATIYDDNNEEITNYDKIITFIAKDDLGSDFGTFSENNIIPDEGVATVELSSNEIGTAIINANSSDGLSDDGSLSIDFTGVISIELTLGEVINWDDYNISFGITITGSLLNLYEMQIVWNNDNATLDGIEINSPYPGDIDPKTIDTNISSSPCIISSISKELIIGESDIRLTFSGSKMKNKNITVTFINEILESFEVTFIVPN
ncbi:MAG: hypothetical protein CEE43_19775 [Promethearchaeota archaeon Loki_b32]|nr:MAG: hypothetical protein CEE43_19775 [Candidatus Lokiarchaeota archaeon Loki_b32]